MGCALSTQMVPTASDILLEPKPVSETNSDSKSEVTFKCLPDIVDEVLDSLKACDSKNQDSKGNISGLRENNLEGFVKHSEVSTPDIFQGSLINNVLSSSEPLIKPFKENSSNKSPDIDSLRTSSPESEIEQALANNIYQNPPTPKPTFSELEELKVYPAISVDTVVNSCTEITSIDNFEK